MRCSSDHFRHPAAIRVDSEARHGKMNTGCNSLALFQTCSLAIYSKRINPSEIDKICGDSHQKPCKALVLAPDPALGKQLYADLRTAYADIATPSLARCISQ